VNLRTFRFFGFTALVTASTLHSAEAPHQPTLRSSRVRRWLGHLFREWTTESWRPIAPAFAKPNPAKWSNTQVTLAWIGHATVLINFFGIKILTDPVFFPRVGIRLPGFTIGPKRLTAPALQFHELPPIDLILLSHAHFDHFDLRTLRCFSKSTTVITARDTSDLLRHTRFRNVTELDWGEAKTFKTATGEIKVSALPVSHWGARKRRDTYRGYNGYLLERNGRRIIFSGDTAMTNSFAEIRQHGAIAEPGSAGQPRRFTANASSTEATRRGCATQAVESTGCPSGAKRVDVAIMSIGAYNPWIQSHCSPEQAVEMANAAGARFIVPVHHQTFRLSFEPFREPIERFEAALGKTPERIALREIGETFVLPL
jgi:L-ascorbate metabolism protein UlaG (beta-lactamase superfamily)